MCVLEARELDRERAEAVTFKHERTSCLTIDGSKIKQARRKK